MNGLLRSRSSRPARSIDRLAAARSQDEERILAEERVAADLLAALDRLEQERVVRVLGDLQERRHRRQQVRDDLLVDGHERPALRQLLELFERRYLHTFRPVGQTPLPARLNLHIALRAARGRLASRLARGLCPVHHSNCRSACATSIGRPSSVLQPGRRAHRAAAATRHRRRSGRRQAARRTVRRQRRLAAPRRAAKRRAIDQQIPRPGRRRPRPRRRAQAPTPAPPPVRAPRVHRDVRAARARAPTTTARAAPPAPRTDARARRAASAGCRLERSQEALDIGVRRFPAADRFAAACSRRRPLRSTRRLRRRGRSASSLNGIVTLAPSTPIASANARKSSKSRAGSGT